MKPVFWYLSFIALLLAGDRFGGWMLHKQAMNSQFRYAHLYRKNAAADILLLGNSRGLTFYQPYIEQITGLKTFNLSYNGLPMDAAKCLVLDYLDLNPAEQNGKPRVMLVDISMCDRENDELLAGFLTYSDASRHLDTLIHRKLPKVWWGAKVSWLFRYNNEIFQRALYHRNKPDTDWLLDREIPKDLAAGVANHHYDLDIQPYLIQNLKETVEKTQAAGYKVKLVIAPYFPGFQVNKLTELKAELEKATGLQVYDYRAALSDPADFGDFMHPNKKGSMKYLDLLKKDGVLAQ